MRLPGPKHRLAIVGKTGSGKTQAALWQLSQAHFDVVPWIILDYKGDDAIGQIPGVQLHPVEAGAPEEPGLYRVRPLPQQEAEVTALLWSVWERGSTGVFLDEGYMIGSRNEAFNALITQGRSKEIPMITLSQRPVMLSRFVFSEADFFQIFHLNDERDRGTIRSFLPDELDVNRRLPAYHSYYYDVASDDVVVLRPVPERDEIMEIFEEKLPAEEQENPKDPLRFV